MRASTLPCLLLVTLAACSSAPLDTSPADSARTHVLRTSQEADTVRLLLGENVRLFPADLLLRVDSLLSDSRCPPTVQCVWAGSVRVRLMIGLAAGGSSVAELETGAGPGATTVAAGYRLTLLDEVSPPAGGEGPYRFPIEVRRVAPE